MGERGPRPSYGEDELRESDLKAIREQRKLFIGGLSFRTEEADLQECFGRFGAIESGTRAHVHTYTHTGPSLGQGVHALQRRL